MKSEKLLSVKWWDANLESFGEFNGAYLRLGGSN